MHDIQKVIFTLLLKLDQKSNADWFPVGAPLFHSSVAKLLYINIETVKIMTREGCRQYAWYFFVDKLL
jgi:hypothetical protein